MKKHPIYLDTARIGLMAKEARESCDDALVLATHDPSLVFREFTRDSESGLIRFWAGLNELKARLLELVSENMHDHLLTASSSGALMALISRCLFSLSCRPLTTDLIWPNHLQSLQAEQRKTGNSLTVVPIREQILRGISGSDLVDFIVDQLKRYRCDALFLTAVSSDGIRLPVRELVAAARQVLQLRMVVVDGAQEMAHLETCSVEANVDGYLFGSHKWLGAYHPLSLLSYGCLRSASFIENTLAHMIERKEINDPTLRMTGFGGRYETLNLLPFFSLAGALEGLRNRTKNFLAENHLWFRRVVAKSGWQDCFENLSAEFKTAISVFRTSRLGAAAAEQLEGLLLKSGLAVTALTADTVRFSMPPDELNEEEKYAVESALAVESN